MAIRLNGEMLVKDMIKAFNDKEVKIVDLCNEFGFSDRTIQKKIKKLGFEWESKEAKYIFTGKDKNVFDIAIGEVFKNYSRNNSEKTIKKEIESASKEIATTIQKESKTTPETTITRTSRSDSKKNIKKDNKKNIDNIDRLLAGKKVKKEYYGFYLDSDVSSVIDSVDKGVKSELVNECLRKVFREKGLL